MNVYFSSAVSFVLSRGASFLSVIPSKISQAVRAPFQLLTTFYERIKSMLFPIRRAAPFPPSPKPLPKPPSPQASSPTSAPSPAASSISTRFISPDQCPHCSLSTPPKLRTIAETYPPFKEALDKVKRLEEACLANWEKSSKRVKRATITSLVTQFTQLEENRALLRRVCPEYTAAFSKSSPDIQALLPTKPIDASPLLKPTLRLRQLRTCLALLVEKRLNPSNLRTMDSLTEEDRSLFSAFIPPNLSK